MKVSKYCLGMMKYYSDREIKSNRFKENITIKEDIMLINVILKKLDEPFTLVFDEDFYLLIMRLAINMVFITILIGCCR